jgi:hypothetical protein
MKKKILSVASTLTKEKEKVELLPFLSKWKSNAFQIQAQVPITN